MVAGGDWLWSLDDDQPVQVFDSRELWGAESVRVWVPRSNAVAHVPATRLAEIEQSHAPTEHDIVWQSCAARILDALGSDTLVAPLEAGLIPLPHQLQALARAVSGDGVRYLLADEVGLGKTIEAGLIVRELKIRGLVRRVLVVAPAGLVTQWVDEFRLRFNERFHLVLPAWFAALRGAGGLDEEDNLWRLRDQVVCPMDAVKPLDARRGWSREEVARHNRQRFEDLVSAGWDLIIVDEAHRLGGSTDQVARYKLGEGLAQAAPYLLLLTATPHQGKTDGFRRLLAFLDEDAFKDGAVLTRAQVSPYVIRTEKRQAIDPQGQPLFKPRRTVLQPVSWEAGDDQHALYEAVSEYVRVGYNQARAEKRNAIGFLMLLMQRLVTSSTRAIRTALERRRDVLELPEGQLSLFGEDIGDEWDSLDGQEQMEAALTSRLKALSNERAEVELLLSAARRCEARGPDVKAVALVDWVFRLESEAADSKLKVLIFTEFVPTQAMLREFLEVRGYTVACLNGSMNLDERRDVQRDFAGDTRILISTDAGGEGLNLQFCHVVVNYDLPWNPMKIEQRIGRVDRIGQTHPVLAINMALQGSVELRVREVLEEKLARILSEFGADKLGDVLDSELAGVEFEGAYAKALVSPAGIDELVEELTAKIRQQFSATKDASGLLGEAGVSAEIAERMAGERLTTWLKGMTVAFLRSQARHGARATEQDGKWNLTWPDGTVNQEVSFKREPDSPGEEVLTLEDARVRGVLNGIAPLSPALPVPVLSISGVSDKVRGLWSLWRVSLQCGSGGGQLFLPLFLAADGRTLQPTAKAIWERLATGDFVVSGRPECLAAELLEQCRELAEARGGDLVHTLLAAHRSRTNREKRQGARGFAARRMAIDRVGLPQARRQRLAELSRDEHELASRIASWERAVPGLDIVMAVQVSDRAAN